MTTAQVVETSVTVTNSSFQNYTHPDDHTTRTIKVICGIDMIDEAPLGQFWRDFALNSRFRDNRSASGEFVFDLVFIILLTDIFWATAGVDSRNTNQII